MGNEIRLGKVSAVDHPAGMVRVVYHEKDDDVTRMIPILSTVFSGVYSMPEVGDQVLVLHLSNGTEAGVVLGRPWSEKTKPPEGAEKLYRLDMDRAPGVAMVRYDGKAKDLTIHCDGTLNITAGGAITITRALEDNVITGVPTQAQRQRVAWGEEAQGSGARNGRRPFRV